MTPSGHWWWRMILVGLCVSEFDWGRLLTWCSQVNKRLYNADYSRYSELYFCPFCLLTWTSIFNLQCKWSPRHILKCISPKSPSLSTKKYNCSVIFSLSLLTLACKWVGKTLNYAENDHYYLWSWYRSNTVLPLVICVCVCLFVLGFMASLCMFEKYGGGGGS